MKKNISYWGIVAVVAVFVTILTFLIGNEGAEVVNGWVAAAFAGFASGSSVAISYAVGKNDGEWNAMFMAVVIALVVACITGFAMML